MWIVLGPAAYSVNSLTKSYHIFENEFERRIPVTSSREDVRHVAKRTFRKLEIIRSVGSTY
jgi:hypothetical protein